MSIWGKIAGVAAGYAIGGVPGAVFGALAGHFVLDRINDRQVIFTIALISLAAKMTRADGIVSPIEVQAVQSVLRVPKPNTPIWCAYSGWRRKMLPVSTLMPARFAIFMPTARKCWRMYWTFCFTSPMQTAICIRRKRNFCTLSRRFSKLTKAAYAACRHAMTVRFKTRMWCWAWPGKR